VPYRRVDANAAAVDIVKRWLEQYGNRHSTCAQALRALPVNPTPDQVDAAFASAAPNPGHTNRVQREFTCDECNRTFGSLVQIDVPLVVSEYTLNGAEQYLHLCYGCVLKLVKFVQ
jgi:hypothetical protein